MCRSKAEGGRRCGGHAAVVEMESAGEDWPEYPGKGSPAAEYQDLDFGRADIPMKTTEGEPWPKYPGKGTRHAATQDLDHGPWPQPPQTAAEKTPGFDRMQEHGREIRAQQRLAERRARNRQEQSIIDLNESAGELSDRMDAAAMKVRTLLGLGESEGIASRRKQKERSGL